MSNTDFERICGYYAKFNEWDRLETPEGKFEFQRTLELLEKYLRPQSRVLDLGGGPGRYTIALAQRAHHICLADLSPELLEIAQNKIKEFGVESQIDSVDEVNATDLSKYQSDIFDAVLAFGPFYHLTIEAERKISVSEIRRVLKSGGLVFVSFIPRLSGLK